jgi:hypothetical protein
VEVLNHKVFLSVVRDRLVELACSSSMISLGVRNHSGLFFLTTSNSCSTIATFFLSFFFLSVSSSTSSSSFL